MKKIVGVLFLFLAITSTVSAQKKTQPAALKASIDRGKIVYEQYCLACHQVDGSGVPHLNPPLIKTSFVLGEPAVIIDIVLNGLNEEIEINGNYYSNPMPPLGEVLKDEEIADVLTYIRNSFGNKASAVTEAQVKEVRAKTK